MQKVLIINGHPNPDSFNYGIAAAYKQGALTAGAEVKEIVVADLIFNLNLKYGYQKRSDLEPDLLDALEKLKWCDHMVWIHPVWWGGLPAILKGFIDRIFLPGFVFQYRENSVWWDKLLIGKSARIITTLDQPSWYYWLMFGRPSVNQLKKSTLEFCGVKPVKVSYIGPIRNSTAEFREKQIKKISQLGADLK
ncbi:MAG: NAD(P)H-dependent oxidoreductase [Chitinophagales bacterium]|nr:NAD(P)H-dependent oxidoreductase [Chitinophagales bacterium]